MRISSMLYVILIACLFIAIAATASENESLPAYIINPGDQFIITVVDYEKELTALVIVRPDGMINYAGVNDVKAAGLTITQLSRIISEKLSEFGYYKNPQVMIQFKEPSQKIIYVFGDVMEPGRKNFLTSVSVIEALAAAGGFKETADLANARIIKRQKGIIEVDLKRLLKENQDTANDKLVLESGDILWVPSAIKEKLISVIGYVHRPGQYTVKSNLSIIEALAIAGGPLEDKADLNHIRIIKANNGVTDVDATSAWKEQKSSPQTSGKPDSTYQEEIQPGDSIFVPEKGQICILGSVQNQGQFAINDEISLIEALSLGGIKEGANLKKLKIVRSTGEQISIDASGIWKQPERYNKEKLSAGDKLIVPVSPFRINWNAISSVFMIFTTLYALFRK